VKEAVERRDVSPERYGSYLKLRDELEAAEF
jgi:putative ribosome biogenesis GTPase RsgA